MSQTTGNNDLQAYLHAWADMMITMWEEQIVALKAYDTWELYNSFTNHVMVQSGGDEAKIAFAFRYYGFYVNSGVGREVSKGNSGDLTAVASYNIGSGKFELERKPKPWFDKKWFKSIYSLRRDVARIYGKQAAKSIVIQLNSTNYGN